MICNQCSLLAKPNAQRAKMLLTVRIECMAGGNAGEVEPIGKGLSKARIHYGLAIGFTFSKRLKKSFFYSAGAIEVRRPGISGQLGTLAKAEGDVSMT